MSQHISMLFGNSQIQYASPVAQPPPNVPSPLQVPPMAMRPGVQQILLPPSGFWPSVRYWTWGFLKWIGRQLKPERFELVKEGYWKWFGLALGCILFVKTCSWATQSRSDNTQLQARDGGTLATPTSTQSRQINTGLPSHPQGGKPILSSSNSSGQSEKHVTKRVSDSTGSKSPRDQPVVNRTEPFEQPKPREHKPTTADSTPTPRVKHPDEPPTHGGADDQ
jgi:hypothetical protein